MPQVPGQDIKTFADEANKPTPDPKGVTGRSMIDFAADVDRAAAEKVSASMDASSRVMFPELAARVSRIKSRAPLPEDFIMRNYEELERETNKPKWNFREFVNTSPTVTDYIIDSPSFAGMAPEAIRAMGNLEDLLRRPKLLWPKQQKQMEAEADMLATEQAKQAMADQPNRVLQLNALDMTDLSGVLFKDEKAAFDHFRAEALKGLQEEEAMIASEEVIGPGEVFSRRSRQNPAWWAPYAAGLMDATGALDLYSLSSAVMNNKATPEQTAKFNRIARIQAAEERRGYSVAARATEILMGLPSFGGEMATSGGLSKGLQGGVEKLTKGAVEETIRNGFAKALGYSIGKLGQAAGPMAARSLEAAARFATPQAAPRVEGDKIEFDFTAGDPWSVAILKGVVDTWIEIVSEDSGNLLKWMDAPVNKLLYNAWTPKGVTKTAKGFQEFLSKAGIHGMFSEMGEEEVGKLMRHVAGLEQYKLPTGEELAAEALAFAVPGAVGAGLNTLGRREPQKTNPEFFRSIGDYAKKAIESTKAPEVVEAVVKDAARAAGITSVLADKKAWDEKWDAEKDEAGKPIGGRQAYINIVGDAKGYDEAKGTDIPIPIEKYAVNLAATDHNAYWQDELKVDPEEENQREEKERKAIEQSPEGLTGDAFDALRAKQIKEAEAIVAGLEPGIYTIGDREVEVLDVAGRRKAIDPNSGDEIDLVKELIPSAAMDEAGNRVWDPGSKITKKAPSKPAAAPKPGILGRIKEAVFGKPGEAPDVQADIQQQLMASGNTRYEAIQKAKQFDKVFTNVSRLAKVDKQELFRKFRPTISRKGKGAKGYFQPAFHGSPHKFDKFTTEKIGTGEGAQVYGWGLYFAGNKKVAEFYREKLSRDAAPSFEQLQKYFKPGTTVESYGGFDKVLSFRGADLQHWEVEVKALRYKDGKYVDDPDERPRTHKTLPSAKKLQEVLGDEGKLGRLYSVDVPDDSEYLDLDKPLSQQSENVKAVIERFRKDAGEAEIDELEDFAGGDDGPLPFDEWNGNDFYLAVAEYFQGHLDLVFDKKGNIIENHAASLSGFASRNVKPGEDGEVDPSEVASRYLMHLGLAGNRYLDRSSRSRGEGSHNYVVFDDSRVKTLSYEQPKRGAYVPGEEGGQPFIDLLRKADPSTFLHESAHLYLDMVGYLASQSEVDPKLAKYFQDVLNWFGVKDVAAWNAMSFEEKRPFHEQFAKGFEAYLFEGKAPSLKLKEAFYAFAAWLRTLYKNIKALGVDLTPEVRSIYDRLLATDEEIQEAKSKAHLTPEDPAKAGLTEAQALEINKLTAEADQAAHEFTIQRAMRQYTRSEFKRRESLRAALRAGVEKEFSADPGFRALTILQSGKEPGGEAVAENLKGLSISRTLAEQVAGRETVDSLPSTMFSEGGVHPDLAAGLLGFKSGRELLSNMSSIHGMGSTPQRESAIRQELERLDQNEKALRQSVLALKTETQEANKDIVAGREKIAKRLERAMLSSERESIRSLSEILKGIRDRGGIIPSVETKRIPPRFIAGKEGGILSDMLAQELADRGVISDADSETLYDWLQGAIDAQAAVKDRMKDIPAEAKAIAAQTVGNLPNIIIDNAERRKELHETLKQVATEKSRLEKRSFENWREDVINSQVEARAERNGLNVGAITEAERSQMERDATLAIHNDKQDQLLRKRFEYFVENKFPQYKQLLKTLTKKVSPEKVREEAKAFIGATIALEIKPGLFLRAEQKAARDKIAAYNKGDVREAFDAHEREILNRERYREALRALDKIDSIRAYLSRFDDKSVRQDLGKAEGDYLDQIDAIMARHDFGVASRRKIENRRSLREFVKDQEENDLPVLIPERVLDEASRKSYKEMSLDELEELKEVVQNIAHLSGLKNELVKGAKRKKLKETAENIETSLTAFGGEGKDQKLETRLPGDQLLHKLKVFLASHEKLSMIARQMDGFQDGGIMWENFVLPFNEAGDAKVERSVETGKKMEALEKVFSKDEQIRMGKLEPVSELGGAMLTRWGRICMALNSGNKDNLTKTADGISVTLNRYVSREDVLAVRDTLTEKELDYVQGVMDLFESFKPEVGELHKSESGLEPKWIEAESWTSKYGKEYRGGYYPIKYDERQSSHKIREGESRSLMEGRFISASTSHAHRMDRVKGVRRPILLDRGVIYSGLNDVIHDITHYQAVVNADRLIRESKVHQAINRFYGPEVYGEIRKAILDIAAGDKPTRDAGEDVARFIRRGSVASMMAWNLVSAIQQPFGVAMAVPRTGLKNMLAGFSGFGSAKEIEDTDEWIMANSSFMKNRLGGITGTRELNEVKAQLAAKGYTELKIDQIIESITGGKLDTQDIRDSMYYFQVKMQGIADRVIWKANYKKAMAEADKDTPYPDAHERAVQLANQAVIDTQGSGMVKDRARVERGQGWMQLWTALYSYMSVTLGQNLEALRKTNWKQPESIGRYIADFVFLNTLPILGSMFVFSILRGDSGDDDEGFGEKLAKEHLSYLMGQFIILREMQGFFKSYGDYMGPAGSSMISNIYRFVGQAKQMEADAALLRSLNRAAGALLQYPSNQLDRTVRGVRAILEGETSNILAPLVGPPAQR
jgi:hypothetical protein